MGNSESTCLTNIQQNKKNCSREMQRCDTVKGEQLQTEPAESHTQTSISCQGKDSSRNAIFIGHKSVLARARLVKSRVQNEPFCTDVDAGCVYANWAAECNFSSPFGMKFQLCFTSLTPLLIINASTKSNFRSLTGVVAHTNTLMYVM